MLKDGTVGLGGAGSSGGVGGSGGLTNASRSASDQLLAHDEEDDDLVGASSFVLDEDLPGFAPAAGSPSSPAPLGSAALASSSSAPVGATPLKEDNLLPHDLLGELDEPPTPTASGDSNESKLSTTEEKKEETTAASVTVAEFAAAKMNQSTDVAASPPAPASGADFPSINESSASAKPRGDGLPPKKAAGRVAARRRKRSTIWILPHPCSQPRDLGRIASPQKSRRCSSRWLHLLMPWPRPWPLLAAPQLAPASEVWVALAQAAP